MSSKTKTTATKEDGKPALVPKLRFPDFRDAGGWNQNKLGDVALFFKGKGISKADISLNGRRSCIRYGELYTRYGEVIDEVYSKTDVADTDLFLSQSNDVIIPASGETKLDIAKASCVIRDHIALGGDLNVIRSEHNGVFLSYYFNGPQKLLIAKVAQGDTVVHLYPSQLEKLVVATPSKPEQQKIAECLSSVDEVIAAQARKLDALKTHKKGLMQQLFPSEGETQPRFRFPEFQNAGAWEKTNLGRLVTPVVREKKKPAETYTGLGIRSHGKGTFLKKLANPEKNSMEVLYEVKSNDLILNITFAWEGAIAIAQESDDGALVSHRFPTYTINRGESISGFLRCVILDSRRGTCRCILQRL